jgi:hypothetical protein
MASPYHHANMALGMKCHPDDCATCRRASERAAERAARFEAATLTARTGLALPVADGTAWDRAETDPCERGTVGCSTRHTTDSDCQTW